MNGQIRGCPIQKTHVIVQPRNFDPIQKTHVKGSAGQLWGGPELIYEAPRTKISDPAHPDQSDPESKNGPNEFELDAELFWASGTQ